MKERLDQGKRLREYAAQARAEAETMSDPYAKQILIEIAESYDRLAARADRGLKACIDAPSPARRRNAPERQSRGWLIKPEAVHRLRSGLGVRQNGVRTKSVKPA